jgi:hypothetical protein
MKMAAFWAVEIITLTMDKTSNSETSLKFYQTTWRINPKDRHHKNLTFLGILN